VAVNLALDTNRYVDFCKGEPQTVSAMEQASSIYVPFVVLAELRAGFRVGSRGPENERTLREFLLTEGVRSLHPDEQTTYHYAAVYGQLRKQGTPIPTNDIWIAALVLQHNLVLCARDAHFDHLPQLARV
jgi:tRNA(fMet)-specific endonuclease VapC